MSGEFCCHFAHLPPPLGLRVPHRDSRQFRNDHRGLRPHHVLREVPGHSRQRRPLRRLDRPALLDLRQLLLPASPPIVVGVPLVPRAVRAAMTRSPALGRATRPLSAAHSRVGHEPAATLRTRALLLHAPTIAGPAASLLSAHAAPPGGSFLASRPGSILASVEAIETMDTDTPASAVLLGFSDSESWHESPCRCCSLGISRTASRSASSLSSRGKGPCVLYHLFHAWVCKERSVRIREHSFRCSIFRSPPAGPCPPCQCGGRRTCPDMRNRFVAAVLPWSSSTAPLP
jgi:hypothetical protein